MKPKGEGVVMFCTNCGKKLEDGARFCVYCGAPVGAAPIPAPVAIPAEAAVAAEAAAPAAPAEAEVSVAPAVASSPESGAVPEAVATAASVKAPAPQPEQPAVPEQPAMIEQPAMTEQAQAPEQVPAQPEQPAQPEPEAVTAPEQVPVPEYPVVSVEVPAPTPEPAANEQVSLPEQHAVPEQPVMTEQVPAQPEQPAVPEQVPAQPEQPAPVETTYSGAKTELLGLAPQQPGAYGQESAYGQQASYQQQAGAYGQPATYQQAGAYRQPSASSASQYAGPLDEQPATPYASDAFASQQPPAETTASGDSAQKSAHKGKDTVVRKHKKGHKGLIVATVGLVAVAAVIAVAVLVVVPAVSGNGSGSGAAASASEDNFEGSLYLDTVSADGTAPRALFGISGDGSTLSVYRYGSRISGGVQSAEKVDGGTVYTLSDPKGDSGFDTWGLTEVNVRAQVPDGATADAPFGTWKLVERGSVSSDKGTTHDVRSSVLTLNDDGTGTFQTVYAYGTAGGDASEVDWADALSDSYDVTGDAAVKAANAKTTAIYTSDFTWKQSDKGLMITWTSDPKQFEAYKNPKIVTAGNEWDDED